MKDKIEQEIEAIRTILKVLSELDENARQTVVEYVFKRLDIRLSSSPEVSKREEKQIPTIVEKSGPAKEIHLKDFTAQKQPKSASEMAALVLYYLENLAPEKDRKNTITNKDVETYFKIAEYKLPKELQFTLVNAKNAGYLEKVSPGEYKLNPVGYNLVKHSLPRRKK